MNRTAAAVGPSRGGRPSARNLVVLVASLLGVGVATYLTIAHYAKSVSLVCSDNGVVNCLKVTTSPQSVILHVPVAVLGLAFFVPMVLLNLPPVWQRPSRALALARLAFSVVGIAMVLYLVYTELFTIHAICLWCTSVHVLTFVIFCAVVTGWNESLDPLD